MPTTCDTSLLVPALLDWHPHHREARTLLTGHLDAIGCHVYVETFSVLTRLPDPRRPAPAIARRVLEALERPLLPLSPQSYVAMVAAASDSGVGGGAIYDAVVGATARDHAHTLLTVDRRARAAYDAVGAPFEFIDL